MVLAIQARFEVGCFAISRLALVADAVMTACFTFLVAVFRSAFMPGTIVMAGAFDQNCAAMFQAKGTSLRLHISPLFQRNNNFIIIS